jgi:hypothetical protein
MAVNFTDFNINIKDYTMDELFKLLSVKITATSTYDEIKAQIEESCDNYIKQFESLQKPDIVQFFNQIKTSLIGQADTLSTSEQNVITYNNAYNPSKKNVVLTGNDMYNQNNGAGNPIHRKSVSKLLNIDSRFRTNYLNTETTNFLIDLPYPINNVIEMTLCDLELPSTFYPISESYQNNYFWIRTVDISGAEIFYYIVIPEGNYYFQSLVTYMNSTFQTLFLDFSVEFNLNYNNVGGVGEGTGITTIGIITANDISNNEMNHIVSFDINFNASPVPGKNTSARYTSKNPEYEYYFISTPLDYKQLFGWILGYRKPLYTGGIIDENTLKLFYKSESIIDLTGPKYLFLVVDDFNNSINVNFLTASVKGLLTDNIIARISQKGQLFSIQSQNDFSVYSEPRYYYGPVDISKIQVKLVDEYGRIVDLNRKDFSFTLRLTTIYSVT